jgi:hypothetical protein
MVMDFQDNTIAAVETVSPAQTAATVAEPIMGPDAPADPAATADEPTPAPTDGETGIPDAIALLEQAIAILSQQ